MTLTLKLMMKFAKNSWRPLKRKSKSAPRSTTCIGHPLWGTAGNQEPSGIPQLCGVRLGSMLSSMTGSNLCIQKNMPKTQTSLSSSANIGVAGQQTSSKRSSKTKEHMIIGFEKYLTNSDAIRMMSLAASDCILTSEQHCYILFCFPFTLVSWGWVAVIS